MSFDAAKSKDGNYSQNGADKMALRRIKPDTSEVIESTLKSDERDNLLRVIFLFSSLSYDEAGMVARMMQGHTLKEIADERGEPIQNFHARWKSICRRDPAWQALANGMIGSGRGRKPAVKGFKQMDLFDTGGAE